MTIRCNLHGLEKEKYLVTIERKVLFVFRFLCRMKGTPLVTINVGHGWLMDVDMGRKQRKASLLFTGLFKRNWRRIPLRLNRRSEKCTAQEAN